MKRILRRLIRSGYPTHQYAITRPMSGDGVKSVLTNSAKVPRQT